MLNDLGYISIWWFTLLLVGFISTPICYILFNRFADIGYGFSKLIGTITITYIIFITSTLHVLTFQNFSLYLTAIIYFVLNLIIFKLIKKKFIYSFRKKIKIIIFQEIFFTIGYLLWSYIRSYQPDIEGLEKFMDFGFINSILRSKYLPPLDMWYAGGSINYYWFGHLWTAVITKLTHIPPAVTYNLMLATILGLVLTSTFSLVTMLAKSIKPYLNKKKVYFAGIVSAIILCFAGNFHTPYYVLKDGKDNYWYPDATRFIGYNPETNDKTIHEFPIYSFVVSDLHAHLLNLPIVLLYLALLYSSLTNTKITFLYKVLPLGSIMGMMFMTNTWDFGSYLILTGITSLLFNLKNKVKIIDSVFSTIIFSGFVLLSGLSFALPFILNFESIAKGVAFVNARSPLWQLGILWGFPAILTIIFSLSLYFYRPLKKSDVFIASILITSWLLIFIPEVVYVKDIYISSHHRANTMFKLTYQAFVMFYLSSGYIALKSILSIKKTLGKLVLSVFLGILFVSILWYPSFAIKSYYLDLKNYKGISGENWVKETYPDSYSVISWFRNNVQNQPTILEAPGDSYTDYNLISAYTGLPTVSGWFVHEWLWRGDSIYPQERVYDIEQIYTSYDLELTRILLKKYNIKYVIVGQFEYQKFPNLNATKFSKLGQRIFYSVTSEVYKIN